VKKTPQKIEPPREPRPDESFLAEVEELMRTSNLDEEQARFAVALERGEIAGDLVAVDEEGREIAPSEA
jgi:hypothetical protein